MGCLGTEIEFTDDGRGKLIHHTWRFQSFIFGKVSVKQLCQQAQNREVCLNGFLDTGPANLDRYLTAIMQSGKMNLCDRCRCHRFPIKFGKLATFTRQRLFIGVLQHRLNYLGFLRWHIVLKLLKLQRHIHRQQVDSRGEHLPELDKGGAKSLQYLSDLHTEILRQFITGKKPDHPGVGPEES